MINILTGLFVGLSSGALIGFAIGRTGYREITDEELVRLNDEHLKSKNQRAERMNQEILKYQLGDKYDQ